MKQKLLLPLAGLFLAGLVLVPSVGMAESATSTAQINAISALLQQIQALQSQIDALQASQTTLKAEVATQFSAFVTSLSLGSQGDAVEALQALLAANASIYPEGLITGYFGKATERALKRLQKENDLEQVGRVGPKTRQLLNRLLKDNLIAFEDDDDDEDEDNDDNDNRGKGNRRLCAIVPPGHLIAPGWLKKHDGVRPIVPPCQKLPPGIESILKDGKGTTTPDTMAPVISGLTAGSITTTSAHIKWMTNEKTDSKVIFATSMIGSTTATSVVSSADLTMDHDMTLTGLSSNTTYYYYVQSADKAGNLG